MRLLYLTEPGAILVKDGNRLVIKKAQNVVVQSIGLEQIEGIVMLGSCQLSSGLAVELLEREIPVTWLSSTGKFFGWRQQQVTTSSANCCNSMLTRMLNSGWLWQKSGLAAKSATRGRS